MAFKAAPDFEVPGDAGNNNVYNLDVTLSDGAKSDIESVVVTVTDVKGIDITSTTTVSITENGKAVQTVTAVDEGLATPTYSIVSGFDGSLFTLNATTGKLDFKADPNFESPLDIGADNTYVVSVKASNGKGDEDIATITVSVLNENENPTITSDGGGGLAAINVAENSTAVTTVTATDPDSGTSITYNLPNVGASLDRALFAIDSKTGALSFNSAPNFEFPTDSDKDGKYIVVARASDGSKTDTQTITVTVTDVNDAPSLAATLSATAAENQTSTSATIVATDEDGDSPILYAISGGADATKFNVELLTGVLSFKSAPNFESPDDANIDGDYVVEVSAIDGNDGTAAQTVTVTLTDANDAPTIAGDATITTSVTENSSIVATLAVSDEDVPETLAYTLSGADAGLFTVNAMSKVLSFKSAPNFEAPADSGNDNVYDLVVTVEDTAKASASQTFEITVTNENESPSITGGSKVNLSVNENSSSIGFTITDPDAGDTPTLSITGGTEASAFTVSGDSIVFKSTPNFEVPDATYDVGEDGKYVVSVTATDKGGKSTSQELTITIADVNDVPVITSNGGGTTAAVNFVENSTLAVTTVAATDEDSPANTLTYSISGGADSASFDIDSDTGVLSFGSSPDFEAKGSAAKSNDYIVQVTVADGKSGSDVQTITVSVTDANDAPEIAGGTLAPFTIDENTTAIGTISATDADKDSVSYTISSGADKALFTIDKTSGVLAFISAPDFENAQDAGKDNIYDLVVEASDGKGGVDLQTIAVTVADVNTPIISSTDKASVPENSKSVLTVVAADDDLDPMTYSIVSGGDDNAFFTIGGSTGILEFSSPPNFEAPFDKNGDNVYLVKVKADDGKGNFDDQLVTVTVTNVNENPVITSNSGGDSAAVNVAENSTAVTTMAAFDVDGDVTTYSITGSGLDKSSFAVDGKTGALTFVSKNNFEAPTDSDKDNVYTVVVEVSDGNGKTDAQTINATITDVNDAPVITSNGGATTATVNFVENSTLAVTTVAATDEDLPANTLTYSITGGADSAFFNLDGSTGKLEFKAAPNFEDAKDDGKNNSYVVFVTASDNKGGSDLQTVTVNVQDVKVPSITSASSFSTAENNTAIGTVVGSDDENNVLTYAVAGGSDSAAFEINSSSGELSFVTGRNFESPTDKDGKNDYEVVVSVTDKDGSVDQTITVTVTDVAEAPVITSGTAFSVEENKTAVTTVTATDEDKDTTFGYSIIGGADQALFTINSSGELTFKAARDFEVPSDSDKDNKYLVQVQVTDGSFRKRRC